MSREATGVQPPEIDLRVKEKEPGLGDNLFLARFFSPDDKNPAFECVGIPFELQQLEQIEVIINQNRIKLIDLMTNNQLIAKIDGVPHLAVSGFNVDIRNRVDINVQDSRTTVSLSADGGIARAYLYKNGIGVKGAGLVEYSDTGNHLGFGVGRPIQRTASPNSNRLRPNYQAGGELAYHYANLEKEYSQTYWHLSALSEESSSFARVYCVYPYHEVPIINTNGRYESNSYNTSLGLMIREDGKRGVSKKKLLPAIFRVLPYCLIDENLPSPSFEVDGHNAFIRDGKVIFTDYEAVGGIYPNLESYFNNLFNRWYMDELRKDFPQFCRMYNLDANGNLSNIDWYVLDQTLRKFAGYGPYSLERYEQMDRRDLIKLAMLYVMSQYAMKVSELENTFLSKFSSDFLDKDKTSEVKTVKDVYEKFKDMVESGKLNTLYAFSIGDMVFTVDGQDIYYEMKLNTCGLPFNSTVRHKLTLNNFIASFSERAVKDYTRGILSENPYENGNISCFKTSVYSALTDAFFYMRGSTFFHERTSRTINNFNIQRIPASLTIVCHSLEIEIETNRVSGQIDIRIFQDILDIPIETINRFSYAVHVAISSLSDTELETPQNITIEM